MDRKDSLIKVRTCAVEQSFEHYDTRESATIISRIKSLSWIKTWCFIIHDKDINEDTWEPKKKHFHAVLTFDNATTIWAVAKGLHVEPQFVEKIRTTTKSAQLYLVHRNDDKKYQYPPWEVKANFDYEKLFDESVPRTRKKDVAERIKTWEIKKYNLHEFITIDDYAINKWYYERCFDFRQSIIKNMERDLDCIFISGPSWIWKTTFAKMTAKSFWYECYISSTWKNCMDDYAGQECILLDDLRDTTFPFVDLLKLTDNNTDALIGCRFYNKSIAECKLLIVTSVQTIQEFYKNQKDEEQKQLFRRFKHYMVMTQDNIDAYEYKDFYGWYVISRTFKNPVSQLYGWNSTDFFYDWLQQSMKLEAGASITEDKDFL